LTADLNQNWTRIAPITLRFHDNPELHLQNETEVNDLSSEFRSFYFGDNEITPERLENLTSMYSDNGFFHGAHSMVQLLAKNNVSTYTGMFTYVGEHSVLEYFFGINEVLGRFMERAMHCMS